MPHSPSPSPESPRRFNRRTLLIGGGSAAAMAGLGVAFRKPLLRLLGVGKEDGELTDANRALRAFPDALPTGATVEKRETPGAAWVLAQIATIHQTNKTVRERNDARRKPDPVLNEKVEKFHDWSDGQVATVINPDLRQNLLHLMEQHGMRTIHQEGYLEGREKEWSARLQQASELLELAKNLNRQFGPAAHKGAPDLVEETRKTILRRYTPLELLALEQQLRVLPAENPDAYHLAATTAGEEHDLANKERQKAIIGIMGRQAGLMRFLFMGAGDEFKEATDEWNGAHPKEKVSTMRITAKSVQDHVIEMENRLDEIFPDTR